MEALTLSPHPLPTHTHTPGQNGRHFADDISRCIFVNEKFCILIKISLKFVPKGPINNNPALVQIMAWHRTGNKPLSEVLNQCSSESLTIYTALEVDELKSHKDPWHKYLWMTKVLIVIYSPQTNCELDK